MFTISKYIGALRNGALRRRTTFSEGCPMHARENMDEANGDMIAVRQNWLQATGQWRERCVLDLCHEREANFLT